MKIGEKLKTHRLRYIIYISDYLSTLDIINIDVIDSLSEDFSRT